MQVEEGSIESVLRFPENSLFLVVYIPNSTSESDVRTQAKRQRKELLSLQKED